MPNSSDIDSALVDKLWNDPALMAILTDGVFFDEAPPGSTRFVIVSLVHEDDEPEFLDRAFEDATYQVEARVLQTSITSADVNAAAARIDELLDHGTLTVNGYSPMTMHRESRIRLTEPDDRDPDVRWLRRGGEYRVVMSKA